MLGELMRELERIGEGLLVFYGDHLPAFKASFERLGMTDRRTDYVVWRPRRGPGARIDIAAHELAATIASGASMLAAGAAEL